MADTERDRPEDAPEGVDGSPDPEREPQPEAERGPPPDSAPERERPPPEGDVDRERPARERSAERDVERGSASTAARDERTPTRSEEAGAVRRDAMIWRVVQAVDYLFFLLYSLFLIRFVLALLGASEETGFVRFIHGLTDPFYAPFEGIVARPALDGGYLDFPLAVALIAYVVLHLAIRGLIRVIVGPRPPA